MNEHEIIRRVVCRKITMPEKGEVFQITFCKEKDIFTRYKTIEEIEVYLAYMPETIEDMEYLIKKEWNSGHKMEC